MSERNSSAVDIVRPDELMAELDIKSSTYYEDLKFLDITASKDENQKAYLTNEEAEQVKALRSHVNKNGKREGFQKGALIISSNNKLATNSEADDIDDIYVEAEEPTAKVESDIIREAEELAARGMAMNDLIKIQLASQMSFDDLSPDLQEKINIAHEVANPKFQPAEIASQLLAQHRSTKAQEQG
jgi:hypothetical protein